MFHPLCFHNHCSIDSDLCEQETSNSVNGESSPFLFWPRNFYDPIQELISITHNRFGHRAQGEIWGGRGRGGRGGCKLLCISKASFKLHNHCCFDNMTTLKKLLYPPKTSPPSLAIFISNCVFLMRVFGEGWGYIVTFLWHNCWFTSIGYLAIVM